MASNPFDQFMDRIIAGARQSASTAVAPLAPVPAPMPSAPPPQLAALAALGAAQRMQQPQPPQQSPVAMMAQQFSRPVAPLPPLPDPTPFIQRSRPKTFGAVAQTPTQPAAQNQQAAPEPWVIVNNTDGQIVVMPKKDAQNLPPGWQLSSTPEITDPKSIANAKQSDRSIYKQDAATQALFTVNQTSNTPISKMPVPTAEAKPGTPAAEPNKQNIQSVVIPGQTEAPKKDPTAATGTPVVVTNTQDPNAAPLLMTEDQYDTYYAGDPTYNRVSMNATEAPIINAAVPVGDTDIAIQQKKGIQPKQQKGLLDTVTGTVVDTGKAINSDIIAPATQKAKDIGNAKGSDVAGVVAGGIDKGVDVVKGTVKAGGQVADTGIGLVKGAYDTLPQPVKNVVNPVLDTGKQGIGLVSGGVTNAVGTTVTSAEDVAKQGINATPQGVKDAISAGASTTIGGGEKAAEFVLKAMDKPRQVNVTAASDSMYDTYVLGRNDPTLDPMRIVKGGAAGWITTVTDTVAKYTGGQSYVEWLQQNPDLAKNVYENGYDSDGDGKIDYKGGRALWEAYVGTLNSAQRGMIDTFVDPTMVAGTAGEAGDVAVGAGRAIEAINGASRLDRAVGTAAKGAGYALKLPTMIFDKPVDKIFESGGKAITSIPKVGSLLLESERSRNARELGQGLGSLEELQNQRRITGDGVATATGDTLPTPGKMPPGVAGPAVPGTDLSGATQAPLPSPSPTGPVQTVTDLAPKVTIGADGRRTIETNGAPTEVAPDASLTPGGQQVAGKPVTEVPPEPTVPDESGILNVKPNEKQVIVNTTGQPDDWELFDTAGNRKTEPTTWENLWHASTVEQLPDGSVVLTPGESIARLTSPEARSAANGGMPAAPTPEVPTAPEQAPANDLAAAPAPVDTQAAPEPVVPDNTTPDTSPVTTAPQATVRPPRWVDPNTLPEPITGISNPDAAIHYATNMQQPLKKRLAGMIVNQGRDAAQSGAYHELQRAREVTQNVDRLQQMFPGTNAKVPRPALPADAEAQTMQRVLYEPWAQTSAARKDLYTSTRIKEDVVAARRILVPGQDNATKAMPFRSYVEMVDTHARIVPGDLNDPTFQKAMDKADSLRPIVETAGGGNTIDTVPYTRSPGAVGIIANPRANAANLANGTRAKVNQYAAEIARSREMKDTGLASGSTSASEIVRGRAVGDLEKQDMAIKMPVERATKGSFKERVAADLANPQQETILQRYERLANEHEAAGLSPEEADAKAFADTTSDFDKYFSDAFRSPRSDWKAVRLLQDGLHAMIQLHREATLTNPFTGIRYIANNYIGNAFQLAWTGHGDAALDSLDPRGILRTKRELSIGDQALLTSPAYVKANQRGFVVRNDVRALERSNMELEQGGKTQWAKFLGGVTNLGGSGSRRPGEIVSSFFASRNARDIAHSVDLGNREQLMDRMVDKDWGQVLFDTTSMVERETKGRVSKDAMTQWIGTQPGMSFDQADLREWLMTQGVTQGNAIHIGRNYQNAVNKVYRKAGDEVRRVLFSGKTNADEYLGRAFAFHYWLSRASVLYAKETLKSPAKLAAYGRAVAGMKKLQEEGQVPSSLNGYFRALEGTFGFDVFMNPGAMVSTLLLSLGDPQSFTPQDQNGIVSWLSHRGLMLSAPLGAAIAALGLGGQGQVSDPLGVSTVLRLPIALANYVNATTGGDIKNGVITDPWQGLLQKIREQTSGVSQAIGIPTATKIYSLSGDEGQNREINELILTIAAEQGLISPDAAERAKQAGIDGQALPDEVVTAMDNPDSPLWQAAYTRWATKEVAVNLLRGSPAGVLYPTVKTTTRDTSQRLLADMATSPEVKSQLYDERNLTNAATPEAASLTSNVDQYSRIGTDEQRANYQTYNDILYGNDNGTWNGVLVGNWQYTGAEIKAMTPDQRQQLADQWLAAQGYDTPVVTKDQFTNMSPDAQQRVVDAGDPQTAQQQNDDYIAKRKAFEDQSSPQFQQYKAWQRYIGKYTGGATQYWQDQIASNPSAAEYYRRLPADQKTNVQTLMSPDAFLAMQGKQGDYRSAPGIPTSNGNSSNPLGMTTGGTGGGSTGGSSKPKSDKQAIQDQLDTYQQGLNDVYAFEQQEYGQTFDPNDMNPMSRGAMLKVLANNGLSMPNLGSKAAAYQRWVAAQTPGTDTSIDAYLKWVAYTSATQGMNLNPQPIATQP